MLSDSSEKHSGNVSDMDRAIELAQILNQSLDLSLTRRSPSYRKANDMYSDMFDVADSHRVLTPVFNGRFVGERIPEPYQSLLTQAGNVAEYSRLLLRRGQQVGNAAQEANQVLQEGLIETIGALASEHGIDK